MQKNKRKIWVKVWRKSTKKRWSYEYTKFRFCDVTYEQISYVWCSVNSIKCHFFSEENNYVTCAVDIPSNICSYTWLYQIDPFLYQEPWQKHKFMDFTYTTNGRAARTWRHRIKTLNIHNFAIFWSIFFKLSLLFFYHFSSFFKTNKIPGWTSPLKMQLQDMSEFHLLTLHRDFL